MMTKPGKIIKQGTIYGVGLGPGAVDLMSVRADRLVRSARHVAFFRKAGKPGHARRIVADLLPDTAVEFAMEYPVTTEIPLTDSQYHQILCAFYDDCCQHIRALIQDGEDVVVLCEGDPFFYGSFMHIYHRLHTDCPTEVVPAITGMSGAWTATGWPVTWGDNILSVLMGTLSESELAARLADTDAAVVMKIGQNLNKIRRAIVAAGRADEAYIVEYATMPNQSICRLKNYSAERAPYFSIIILHGKGRTS